jgi:hypothetical protein
MILSLEVPNQILVCISLMSYEKYVNLEIYCGLSSTENMMIIRPWLGFQTLVCENQENNVKVRMEYSRKEDGCPLGCCAV